MTDPTDMIATGSIPVVPSVVLGAGEAARSVPAGTGSVPVVPVPDGTGVGEAAGSGPRARVVTVSTRAAAGVYPDASGPALVELIRQYGFTPDDEPVVVPDGDPVGVQLREAVAAGYALVVTTGGTGLAADDVTPEQTEPLLERQVPGIIEAVRVAGVSAGAPAAMLSRGVAGLAGRTLIVNLPGSVRAIRQAMTAIGPALHHAAEQIAGGDHPRTH